MKCSRCNTNFPELLSGWVKCPKCGLSKFIPDVAVKEEKEVADTPEEEETVASTPPEAKEPEEKKNQADEPINED